MQPAHLEAAAAALRDGQDGSPGEGLRPDLRVPYASLRSPGSSLRVNKWDALILDAEILGLLKTPVKSMFSLFETGAMERVKPEIDAVLGALLFVFTTGVGRATPGMKLENVHYSPRLLSKQRVAALFLLSVAVPYAWKRVFRYLSSARWAARATGSDEDAESNQAARARVLSGMKRVETFVLACQLANLLAFLRKGTYRTLPERFLGLKMESITPSTTPRVINFEYMTRQLLWDGLMEFGSFVLPILTWSSFHVASPLRGPSSGDNSGGGSLQCCLCGLSPAQTPYITSCKHVYCYYCLQTAVATDDEFPCAECGIKFDSSRRLRQ